MEKFERKEDSMVERSQRRNNDQTAETRFQSSSRKPDWVIPGGKLVVREEVWSDPNTRLRPSPITREDFPVRAQSTRFETLIWEGD